MWPNLQFLADLVTSTDEILNRKFNYLCSAHIVVSNLIWSLFCLFCKKNPEISEVKTRDFFNILIKSFHTKGQNFTQYKKV